MEANNCIILDETDILEPQHQAPLPPDALPNMETLHQKYWDFFSNKQKLFLKKHRLKERYLTKQSNTDAALYVCSLFVLVSTAVILFFLPETDFTSRWWGKAALFIPVFVFCGFLGVLTNRVAKKKHVKTIETAAQKFVASTLAKEEKNPQAVAALWTWCKCNKEISFRHIIHKYTDKHIAEKNLNRDLINRHIEHIHVLLDKDRKRNQAERKAQDVEKIRIREELRSEIYHPGQFNNNYDAQSLEDELGPFVDNLSSFGVVFPKRGPSHGAPEDCTPSLRDNIHMAVSPNYLILLNSNLRPAGNPARALLKHNRSTLYIIPPEFIKEMRYDPIWGRWTGMLVEELNALPVLVGHVAFRNKRKVRTEYRSRPLKGFHTLFDDFQKSIFVAHLTLFIPKVGKMPLCPICVSSTRIKRTSGKDGPPGYFCSECNTHYRWGVDYLRRIKLIPTAGNKKDHSPAQWA